MADTLRGPVPAAASGARRGGGISGGMLAVLALLVVVMTPARAGEPPPGAEQPDDMAFIEYLGSWEEDDSDWIALADTAPEESERRQPSAEREQDEEKGTDEDTD